MDLGAALYDQQHRDLGRVVDHTAVVEFAFGQIE
jgi:hypothetical protein